MNLETALNEVHAAFKRMKALYGEAVFDEWIVVGLGDTGGRVHGYDGPRSAVFMDSFARDVALLRSELSKQELDVGGFTFGTGTHGHTYDAAMRIGPATYLLGNHTTRSMDEIRARPQWLKAQVAWFGLGERFREDPVR